MVITVIYELYYRTFSNLKNVNEVTSIKLERGKGLRQPRVSIAAKELKEHDWINE